MHTLLAQQQLWTLVIGLVTPLPTYLLNHYAFWVSEPIKAGVQVVAAAAGGALYTALATNVFGWNTTTLQLLLTAVASALAAHHLLWKPGGISTKLKAGSNAPHRHLGWVSGPPANPPAA